MPKARQIEDVEFLHFRKPRYESKLEGPVRNGVCSQGGATFAYVERDGIALGAMSYCHPSDNFSRMLGRNKAEGRLVQLLANAELEDENKYFIGVLDDYNNSLAEWLQSVRYLLTSDLEYV